MVDIRITKARSSLVISQPFFGTLALHLKVQEDETIETMATDGVNLIYAPAFLDTITHEELKGVIVHEVLHCAYRHPTRRKNREMQLWNEACDYVINMDVLAAGFQLPADRLLDIQYKGMSAEEIYARLHKAGQQQQPGQAGGSSPQNGQGQGPSKGQGAGLSPQPGTAPAKGPTNPAGQGPTMPAKAPSNGANPPTWGKVLDPAPSHKQADIQAIDNDWKVRVTQALSIAGKQAGKFGGTLERLFNNVKKPTINWRDELRRFIDDKVHTDFTWTNPNKRYLNSGFVMPGIQKDSIAKLGIAIDTSGSINQNTLNKFRAEIQDVLDNGAVQEVMVLYCDDKVQGPIQSFAAGDIVDMRAQGGGGTMFSPAIQWFIDNEPDVGALIYFTDLQCDDFGSEPPFSVMWAAYGYESFLDKKTVPFGEIIKLLEN